MKKSISKLLRLLCLLIALTAICMPVKAQQNPPDTTQWQIGELSSPDAVFPDVQRRANAYFDAHPEMDSLNPLEKDAYRRWEHFWKDRAYINGSSEPGMLKYVLKAMSDTNELKFTNETLNPNFLGKWNLISPNEFETQNLGVVTAIWVNPENTDNILIGTEKSGLWKTINGGLNWVNITDSYNMPNNDYITAAGFGISSIAVDPTNYNIIFISCFSQSADLVLGYGRNILKTTDGGNNWSTLGSYKLYLENNPQNFHTNVWKIKLDPGTFSGNMINRVLYAAIGKKLVALSIYVFEVYNEMFELGVDEPVPNNGNRHEFSYLERRIRDFEIILSGINENKRSICLSTDGFRTFDSQNNIIVNMNAELYYTNYTSNPLTSGFNPSWTRTDLNTNPNYYVDNAAIVIDDINTTDPSFYIAWYKKSDATYGQFNISHLDVFNNQFNNYIQQNYSDINRYPEIVNTNYQSYPFNGWGYRYDAFEKVRGAEIFFVGGYDVVKIEHIFNLTDNYFDFSFITYNQQASGTGDYSNQNYNKNKYCHNGIRAFNYDYNGKALFIGNEGGISKYNFYTLKNINGKGLSINSFTNLSTTQYNNRDVIVASSFRNGIWHYENGFNYNKWRQFYWEDGGSLLINDQNPDNIFNIKSSVLDLSPSGWGSQIYKTNTSLSFINQTGLLSHTPANVMPSLTQTSNFSNWGSGEGPLEFCPANNQIIYNGRHDIWESINNGASWDAIYSFPNNYWCGLLKSVKIAPSDPNIIYAAFDMPTWSLDINGDNCYTSPIPPQLPQIIPCPPSMKLWRGIKTSGNWQFTDLTNNLSISIGADVLSWANVTDIAINPVNTQEVWITINHFHKLTPTQGRWRVFHTNNSGLTWTDYSTGLSPAPVNCIKHYSYGGKNLLFVGTDVGVFSRDPDSPTAIWESFNDITNKLPMCIVTDLEIYYPDNKLRASTYGRGIWEAEIPCISDSPISYNFTDGQNIIWSDTKWVGDVYINSGATLTITGTVHFQQGRSLTVEPGGKLIVIGGTLTDMCNKMWNGVDVNGWSNEPQSNTNKHGIIDLTDGTISNAIVAVELVDPYMTGPLRGGGIIKAHNTNFINNQKAIVMYRYENIDGISYRPKDNFSNFRYCNFKTDDNYHDATNYLFSRFIHFDQIRGVKVEACSFANNTSTASLNFGIGEGIYSNTSKFTVEGVCSANNLPGVPCPSQYINNSSFTNLQAGIYAVSTNLAMNFTVKNTIFDNNLWGAIAMGINNVWFTENTFKIPDKTLTVFGIPIITYGWGLYLDGCQNGYAIEGNSFTNINGLNTRGFTGMIVNNSLSPVKTVYNNTFINLKYGFLAQKDNGGNTDASHGLKVKCNDFIDCSIRDIAVTPLNALGVSPTQGADLNVSSPSGNTFNHLGPTGTPTDFDNQASNTPIYYHHQSPAIVIPQFFNNITPTPISIVTTYSKPLACPAIALQPGGGVSIDPGGVSDAISAAQIQLNSAKLILQIWVDGGNTEGLKQTVELSYPWEAYTLYNELLINSPYLSDEVLIAAIQNEEGLPPLMLKLVLLANPQAVRSPKVMDALYKRNNPFPEEWIIEIRQGLEVVSQRNELEANVGYYAQERQLYFDLLKAYYISDTSQSANANLIALLTNTDRVENAYELVFTYLANDDTIAADALIGTISATYNLLTDEEQQQYIQTQNYYNVLKNVKEYNYQFDKINPEYLNWIVSTSESEEDTYYTANARALRMLYDTSYHYINPVWLPEDGELKMSKPDQKSIAATKNKISISPNPANEYFIIKYAFEEEINNASADIYDAIGRKINTINIADKIDQMLIKCSDYINGQYYCILKNNNKMVNTIKFNVTH